MKALILSDSHKNFQSILDIMEEEKECDLIIHAGDVQRDVDDIRAAYPQVKLEYVMGNNEYAVTGPANRVFDFGGKTVFLTHGHLYSVKYSLTRLHQKAKSLGADICIFGHTHQPLLEETGGILFINPGSTWRTYAVLTVEDGKAAAEIRRR